MGEKFYRYERGEPPCTLDELLAVNDDVWSGEEIAAMRRLEFGQSIRFGGGAAAEYEILCVGDELGVRVLETLETYNSLCMDDDDDRIMLARALLDALDSLPSTPVFRYTGGQWELANLDLQFEAQEKRG